MSQKAMGGDEVHARDIEARRNRPRGVSRCYRSLREFCLLPPPRWRTPSRAPNGMVRLIDSMLLPQI